MIPPGLLHYAFQSRVATSFARRIISANASHLHAAAVVLWVRCDRGGHQERVRLTQAPVDLSARRGRGVVMVPPQGLQQLQLEERVDTLAGVPGIERNVKSRSAPRRK